MFHACATRFDVTENLENFLVFKLNKAAVKYWHIMECSTWSRMHANVLLFHKMVFIDSCFATQSYCLKLYLFPFKLCSEDICMGSLHKI